VIATIGAAGTEGGRLITTFAVGVEVQPAPSVTVKLYVPEVSVNVVLEVKPVDPTGLIVQPPAGNPFNTTSPKAYEHVGWVIVPTIGTGTDGAFIVTGSEAGDIQPEEFWTVKLYVFEFGKPVTVAVVPVPVAPPGLIVQVPVAGNPPKTTLPVGTAQVGWVIVPMVGAVGKAITFSVKVAVAAAHGDPKGLFDVSVIVTVLPPSPARGV
jgi:hypothetical protein